MKVEIINFGDPLVLVGYISASCDGKRTAQEHEAGLHLLNYGIDILCIPMQQIYYDENGKPFFADSRYPYFSISHSNRLVACAISHFEIGCDIEKIKKIPHVLDEELKKIQYIINTMEDHSSFGRTSLWTKYEAIGKCIGKGIPVKQEDIIASDWIISDWTIQNEYILSVAMRDLGIESKAKND